MKEQINSKKNVLSIRNLKVYFPVRGGLLGKETGRIHAVDDVSFDIRAGETFGVVGESGCGKSTLGNAVLRFINPTDGAIFFQGENLVNADSSTLSRVRKKMQVIFQDPMSSLNPRIPVGTSVGEALMVHQKISKGELKKRVADIFEQVGLNRDQINRYPHEFSGGQRQRIVIARALIMNPDLIICDEPVSALDVSIQSQILNLLMDLQKDRELSYMFISHDLSVVRHICDRVAVIYLGRIAELTDTDSLFDNPMHPYTQLLISAIPQAVLDREKRDNPPVLNGELPSPSSPPPGCAFQTRCPKACALCREKRPELREKEPGHWVACHMIDGDDDE